jgi:hypothetical protein
LREPTKHGATVKGLEDDVATAERKGQTVEIQVEGAQIEVAKWKQQYEKLRGIMCGAVDEMT